MEGMGNKTVSHPPHCPDLTPCDFWLYSELEENLRSRHFEDTEKMEAVTTEVVDTFTLKDSVEAFMKWLECYKCIDVRESHFEGVRISYFFETN